MSFLCCKTVFFGSRFFEFIGTYFTGVSKKKESVSRLIGVGEERSRRGLERGRGKGRSRSRG